MAIHGSKRVRSTSSETRTKEGRAVRGPVSDEARKLEGRERAKSLALRSLVSSNTSAEGLARALAVSPTQAKRYLHDDGLIPVAALLTALEHDEGRAWGETMVRELLVVLEVDGADGEGAAVIPDVASLACFAMKSSAALDSYATAISDGYLDRAEAARTVGMLRAVVSKAVELITRLERPVASGGEPVEVHAPVARARAAKGRRA